MKDTEAHLGSRTCRIINAPECIDAGAAFSFRVEVGVTPATDLLGEIVEIIDGVGQVVASAPLSALEGDPAVFSTGDIQLTAPGDSGPQVWTARLAAFEDGGASLEDAGATYPEVTEDIEIAVEAHRIAPVVWDVAPAVVPGARFRVKIGARCSSACTSAGWTIAVTDQEGRTLAEARTGKTPWAGTEGLRFAEVALTAPEEIGLFALYAAVAAPGADLPHQTGRRRFNIRTMPPLDAELRIRATDAVTGRPVEGLKVAVHPFDTRTGPDGLATVAVPKGDHTVFVSGKGFIPYAEGCSVDGVHSIEVAIVPEPVISDADVWG